jgi:hypothetical protein
MITYTSERPEFATTVPEQPEQWMVRQLQPAPVWVVVCDRLTPKETTGFASALTRVVADRSADLPMRLRESIQKLSDLPQNWDGEGASAVKVHVLADIVEVLKRFSQRSGNLGDPFLAPTFEGFIQIEWHRPKRSLEIEAVRQGWSVVGTMHLADGGHYYLVGECGRSDFAKLGEFYEWFLGTELIWPSL